MCFHVIPPFFSVFNYNYTLPHSYVNLTIAHSYKFSEYHSPFHILQVCIRLSLPIPHTQTFEVYGCADCSGCKHKAHCLYKYNAEKDTEKNKIMKINEHWEELREKSHANIQSERGILKWQTRSIQTRDFCGQK